MNIKEIKEMIKLMNENEIREFELERDGFRVLLKRGAAESVSVVQPVSVAAPVSVPVKKDELEADKKAVDDAGLETIVSPMVGTFYSSPSPESDPFVGKGDKISTGDVVCIVEAMKVMNEIKAEVAGTIEAILVENGEAVEFGQPLFKIKKK